MAKYDYDVIVIGGGAAGLTSSTACSGAGKKTLLLEKEEKLGGDCLHYGCVPSKSLIKSAYAYNVMRHADKYGLPKVEVPKVDYKNVASRISGIIDSIQVHDDPEHLKKTFKVETKFGEAKFLDKHTIQLNGDKISAKNFVLAMGSSPAVPPIEGIKDVPYITNIDVFSLDKLPEKMIVLGGGPIGMEMAQAFARLGTKVTAVQHAPQILNREDPDVSEHIAGVLKADGVDLMCSTKAVKVGHNNGIFKVTVEKDGKKSTLEADQLLVATGRSANVNGLDLEKAGVEYDKRGIKVDKKLRTTAKNIFACGDINGSFPFTHVAAYEAIIAMTNILSPIAISSATYTNVPWVTYLDPEIASVGYNETRAKEAGIDYVVHKEDLAGNDRAKAEGETGGFVKVILNKKGVPIGCQIVGYHAGDLIHEWVALINGKVSLYTIGSAIHAYPTMSEINKAASINYFLKAPTFVKLRLLLNWRW